MGYFQVRYNSRVVNYNHKGFIRLTTDCMLETCGQSYKQFTLVNYDYRVVIWGIFKSGMTLEL